MSNIQERPAPPTRWEVFVWLVVVGFAVAVVVALMTVIPVLIFRNAASRILHDQQATATARAVQGGFQPSLDAPAADASGEALTPTPDLRPTEAEIGLILPGAAVAATVAPLPASLPTDDAVPKGDSSSLNDGNAATIPTPEAVSTPDAFASFPCADFLAKMRRVSESSGTFPIALTVQGDTVTIDYSRSGSSGVHWVGTLDKAACSATGHYDDLVNKKAVGRGGTVTITRNGSGFTGTWQQVDGRSGPFNLLATDQ
jgi:hypothetical protein